MLIHWKLTGNLNFVVMFLCARLNGVQLVLLRWAMWFLCSGCVFIARWCKFLLGAPVSIKSRLALGDDDHMLIQLNWHELLSDLMKIIGLNIIQLVWLCIYLHIDVHELVCVVWAIAAHGLTFESVLWMKEVNDRDGFNHNYWDIYRDTASYVTVLQSNHCFQVN